MKRVFLYFLIGLSSLSSRAQNGLEGIIVERYYVSDKNDSGSFGGHLPIGSITYRVFVDLLPRYRFQAAYGISGHTLSLKTSTLFYNNNDRGASIPNVIPERNLKENTVMLDSWLSVGAASETAYGVLKSQDSDENTVIHENGMLQNADPLAGIPLKQKDGLLLGNVPRPTVFGMDEALQMFKNKSLSGSFTTENGSWASLSGSVGIDSLTTNRLLIGQFTTDGVFSFELNIQIGTPSGGVENYVARNPVSKEILLPDLIFSSANETAKPKSKTKLK